MKRLQAWMKRHWVVRNVIGVVLGVIGWYIGAYLSEVHLKGTAMELWIPVVMVALLVVPFVAVFVGPSEKRR